MPQVVEVRAAPVHIAGDDDRVVASDRAPEGARAAGFAVKNTLARSVATWSKSIFLSAVKLDAMRCDLIQTS